MHEVIVAEAARDSDFPQTKNLKVLHCDRPSRGKQMNDGAANATGDVLIFLHADTQIERAHFEAIERAMSDPAIVGGAFYRKFDERHPHLRSFEGVGAFSHASWRDALRRSNSIR